MSAFQAEAEDTVESALAYAENPDSVTSRSHRTLALEVRRLRKEALDMKCKLDDLWRRVDAAESKQQDPYAAFKQQGGQISGLAYQGTTKIGDVR